ncbi:hypothetical protein L596_005556 [Steinernema carpocapsae]|uniref:Protein kinase domain-containing protein n=1 Tax=Steinernema carpocapsae TaxID=34508 RepID=A0A4U8V0K2_STECR|nr:hypothetical protein L596_005556 [Steinernema carpocapsae]
MGRISHFGHHFHPDLQSVLRESRAVSHDSSSNANASLLSAERLFSMMTGVAHGTGHLIKQRINQPLLASCNVLVTERGLVRIAGFGLANHQQLHGSMHNPRPPPIRWQAPECFEPEFTKATGQSLIWSLVWEITSLGATPYANNTSNVPHGRVLGDGEMGVIKGAIDILLKGVCDRQHFMSFGHLELVRTCPKGIVKIWDSTGQLSQEPQAPRSQGRKGFGQCGKLQYRLEHRPDSE